MVPSLLSLAAAAALVASPLASGQEGPAPAAPAEPAAPSAAAPSPARPPPPAVRFVLQAGYDLGSDRLVETTGGGRSIRANGGNTLAIGAAFLPLLDGRLYTQATVGLRYDVLAADNGDATYVAFPLQVIEFVELGPLRLGAGIDVHLGGLVELDGEIDGRVDLEPAIGFVAQADWVWQFRGAARGFLTVGPRVVLQQIEVEDGGTLDANAVGLVLGFTF